MHQFEACFHSSGEIYGLDHTTVELTPEHSVRTTVHEYGGGAFAVCLAGNAEEHVVFANAADQNLYRLTLKDGAPGPIEPLTDTPTTERHADLEIVPSAASGVCCIAVRETHQSSGEPSSEPVNDIVAVTSDGAAHSLLQGHDFYAAPRLSDDDTQLLCLAWDHPNMPWDGTQLLVTDLDTGLRPTATTTIAGGADVSIAEPVWMPAGSGRQHACFTSDERGFWNLYGFDESGVYPIVEDSAEYAGPAWNFGGRHVAFASTRHAVCQRVADGQASLCIVDMQTGISSPLTLSPADDGGQVPGDAADWVRYGSLTVAHGRFYCIVAAADRGPGILEAALDGSGAKIIHGDTEPTLANGFLASAEPLRYDTRDGRFAYAYYYAPTNPDFAPLPNELPPLIVMAHGGPTAATSAALNLRIQYYTTRGWAVVDIDYRGSTGYGRAYRDALAGRWGELDVDDCVDAVNHLITTRRADPPSTPRTHPHNNAAVRVGTARHKFRGWT